MARSFGRIAAISSAASAGEAIRSRACPPAGSRSPLQGLTWTHPRSSAIEIYRQQHRVKDPDRALGRDREREIEQRETLRRIHESQRVLGLGQHVSRVRDLGRSLGIR